MRKKRSGAEYERHCASKMKWHGWIGVTLIGKSHDYGADIIARGLFFRKIVVQCKSYSKPVGVKAVPGSQCSTAVLQSIERQLLQTINSRKKQKRLLLGAELNCGRDIRVIKAIAYKALYAFTVAMLTAFVWLEVLL